jgi:hypothetical protein
MHVDVVVGAGNVDRATPSGTLKKIPALVLKSLHAEGGILEVLVHVRAITDKAVFSCAVESDLQGQDAD